MLPKYKTVTGLELKLEGGKVDMCIAIDEMRREAAELAAEKATVIAIKNLMENLKLTAIQAMNALGIPDQEQPRYLAML